MPSKQLMTVWTVLDLCLLAAGAISLAFSIVWRSPDLLRDLVISDMDLTMGMALGIIFLITWVVSVGAIVQRNHVTIGLVILNWFLIATAIAVAVVGSSIWFFTLRERDNFHEVFANQTPQIRLRVQDQLNCCGYFNSTDLIESGGICTPPFAANTSLCVDAITSFADYTLNNVFTTIYGFMAIIVSLFLASLCVIKKRMETDRFRKIDAKRGGRGFV